MTTIVLDAQETDTLCNMLVEFVIGQKLAPEQDAREVLAKILDESDPSNLEAELSNLTEDGRELLEQMSGRSVADVIVENTSRHNVVAKILAATNA